VALGATIYTFEIRLADSDRQLYETLALKVARHPSETAEFLWTRVIAYCLEHQEGISFSKGLSDTEQPAILVNDLSGVMTAWIEVGSPDAARLHKASKAAARVAVYLHRAVDQSLARWREAKIHRAEAVDVRAVDPLLLEQLVERLDRRMVFDLSVAEGTLYVGIGEETLTGDVVRHHLAAGTG
jgi:uncharacterized protein YaeQ